ncbi:MAG: XdhC family protein [Nevskiaceae bacterium]|jgi:xanthine dehydrogenase accessory factor|nr:XdhC family protein [Nevskiaceae bacterium]
MQRSLLDALLEARAAARAVVLLTPLNGDPQRLLDEAGLELLALTDAQRAGVAREALASDRALTGRSLDVEVLVTPHNPPLRLIIIGAVHIAESLCRIAGEAGYAVTVVDPRSAFVRAERFPGVALHAQWPQQVLPTLAIDQRTAVVLLTHDPKIDDPALHCVLRTDAFYIGALGSTRTHARRLERLAAEGLDAAALSRIHGPAGLNIGARTPAEIALSILAQITVELRGVKSS